MAATACRRRDARSRVEFVSLTLSQERSFRSLERASKGTALGGVEHRSFLIRHPRTVGKSNSASAKFRRQGFVRYARFDSSKVVPSAPTAACHVLWRHSAGTIRGHQVANDDDSKTKPTSKSTPPAHAENADAIALALGPIQEPNSSKDSVPVGHRAEVKNREKHACRGRRVYGGGASGKGDDQILHVYVGYREVAKARGISRRTLERQVRGGSFPRPERISPGRVGWRVEVLNAHHTGGC